MQINTLHPSLASCETWLLQPCIRSQSTYGIITVLHSVAQDQPALKGACAIEGGRSLLLIEMCRNGLRNGHPGSDVLAQLQLTRGKDNQYVYKTVTQWVLRAQLHSEILTMNNYKGWPGSTPAMISGQGCWNHVSLCLQELCGFGPRRPSRPSLAG